MERRGAFYTLVPYVIRVQDHFGEFYLQKNVLICDIGINKMYVGFVIWIL
jgi:hypothetical protein